MEAMDSCYRGEAPEGEVLNSLESDIKNISNYIKKINYNNEYENKEENKVIAGKEEANFAETIKELRDGDGIKIKNGPNRAIISKVNKQENKLNVIYLDEQKKKIVEKEFLFEKEAFTLVVYSGEENIFSCFETVKRYLKVPQSAHWFNNNNQSFVHYCKTKFTTSSIESKATKIQMGTLKTFLFQLVCTGGTITMNPYLFNNQHFLESPSGGIYLWLKENKGYRDFTDAAKLLCIIQEITEIERDKIIRWQKNRHMDTNPNGFSFITDYSALVNIVDTPRNKEETSNGYITLGELFMWKLKRNEINWAEENLGKTLYSKIMSYDEKPNMFLLREKNEKTPPKTIHLVEQEMNETEDNKTLLSSTFSEISNFVYKIKDLYGFSSCLTFE